MTEPIILPDYIGKFMDHFKKEGYEIYVVGGAIRDLILRKKTDNWDFTTNATPEEIQKLFPDSFYNNDYGTVSVPGILNQVPNDTKIIFEITPFRKETSYKDK